MKTISFLILLLSGSFLVNGQVSGQYDLRFNNADVDEVNLTFEVDIEVKASSPTTNFNLAEQNYRVVHSRALTPGSVSLITEGTISGFVIEGTTSSFYSPHTLTGSIDTVVSYNIELAGGDGYPVSHTDWVFVGRLGFGIEDLGADIKLEYLISPQFPPTVVIEKVAGALSLIGAGASTDLFEAGFCSTVQAPNDLATVALPSGALEFTWDNNSLALGCQIKAEDAAGNILGYRTNVNSPLTLPSGLLSPGVYVWSVRCACSTSPLAITPFSATESFVAPSPRVGETASILDEQLFTLQQSLSSDQLAILLSLNALSPEAAQSRSFTLELFDLNGSQLVKKTLDFTANDATNGFEETQTIDIAAFQAGAYFIRLTNSNGTSQTEQFVKF